METLHLLSSKRSSDLFAVTYSKAPATLQKIPIDDGTLATIGRLVRGIAELDNCVDCFVMCLAEISETNAIHLLGRQGISAKISLCFHLARARDDSALSHHKRVFSSEMNAIIKARNVVAHGRYLGKDSDDNYCFMSSEAHVSEENKYGVSVYGYPADLLRTYADIIEETLPEIENVLQIAELRRAHLQQSLNPHPKGRKG